MSNILLQMKNVTKRFPGVVALKNVNLELVKGEILGICGENGAGKSTLMKVLSGSYRPDEYEGQIIFEDTPVTLSSVSIAEKYGIEMISQEISIVPTCTVAENLFIGHMPGKGLFVDYRSMYAKTQEILDYIQLDVSPKDLVSKLNSGQIQMLSLMRAYVKNPKILVLDEPTSALTDNETELLMSILNELRGKGVSCIYISHKLNEVFRICDRILVLRDGETISCHKVSEVNTNTLIENMIGRKVESLYPKGKADIGGEVLRVEGITVPHPMIKGKNIVENISFSLRKGEILGIGGLVGAGRSEILGAIFGQFTNNVTKKVFIKGNEVLIQNPSDAIEAGIGFVTEERKRNGIIAILSIRENIAIASLKELSNRIFMNEKVEKQRVQSKVDQLRIKAPSMKTPLYSLSGGNQQKAVVGKWLLKNPEILLVDEPTRGIDVGSKAEIYKLMSEMTQNGISIIMVSSDMPELVNISDRCIVISNGRITGEFTGDEITDEAVMRAAISD